MRNGGEKTFPPPGAAGRFFVRKKKIGGVGGNGYVTGLVKERACDVLLSAILAMHSGRGTRLVVVVVVVVVTTASSIQRVGFVGNALCERRTFGGRLGAPI